MINTTQVLAASLIIAAIFLLILSQGILYQEPNVPFEQPIEVTANLKISCTKSTIDIPGGRMDIVTSLSSYLHIAIKNLLDSDVIVDKIVPLGPNVTNYIVELPESHIPGRGHVVIETPSNWLNMSGLVKVVHPGDWLVVDRGTLKVRYNGLIREYKNTIPPYTPPSEYTNPFAGDAVYSLTTSGNRMSARIGDPGYAGRSATRILNLNNVLILTDFRGQDYFYDNYDIQFYVDIFNGDRHGGAYFLPSGVLKFINGTNITTGLAPGQNIYLALNYNNVLDQMQAYINDDTAPRAEYYYANLLPGYIVVGLARERPALGDIYLALVIDSSGSMGDDWNSLYNAIANAIDVLQNKSVKIAVEDFTSPEKCTAGPYNAIFCSEYVRIWNTFTDNYNLVLDIIQNIQISGGTEPDADAVYIAASKLPWSRKDIDRNIIVLSSDEPNQEVQFTTEQAITAAQNRNIMIVVVRPNDPSTSSLDVYAQETGGEVVILGQDASNLGEALIDLIERINMTPALISSDLNYLGIFSDPSVRISGLYPGDTIILSTPNDIKSITANNTEITINLLELFGAKELIRAMENGGVLLAVKPSPTHILSLLPSSALVHVTGENIDKWVRVHVMLEPNCTIGLETIGIGTLTIEREGDVYRVSAVLGGNNIDFGVFPKVYVKDVTSFTITIYYMDGTTLTITPNQFLELPTGRVYVMQPFGLILLSDKPLYSTSGGVLEDSKSFRKIVINGAFRVEGSLGK